MEIGREVAISYTISRDVALSLPRAMRWNFAELTAASELDIAAVNPDRRPAWTRSARQLDLDAVVQR